MKVYLLTYASDDANNSFIVGIFTSIKGAKDKAQEVYEGEEPLSWNGPSGVVVDYSYDGYAAFEIQEYTLE